MGDSITLAVSIIAAIAAGGAWFAAWYPSRFVQSWLIETAQGNNSQYLVRNNTRREALVLETQATALFPDRPDQGPIFALDEPAAALLNDGESFGIMASRARGLNIVWTRKIWWKFGRAQEYSREIIIPIRYS